MSILTTILVLSITTLTCSSPSSHTCSPSTHHTTHNKPCPPFDSPPTYPFSASPGCNHPSFQITCSTPHSLISISSLTFSLLSLSPSSKTFTLSYSQLPPHPINLNLTSSPFHLLSDPCPLLANLAPCSNRTFSDRSRTWQQQLLQDPLLLFSACSQSDYSGNRVRSGQKSTCVNNNVSESMIAGFLKTGFQVKWDLAPDPYNRSCSYCHGSCGFNDTDAAKSFLCFDVPNHKSPHLFSAKRLLLVLASCSFAVMCVCVVFVFVYARRRFGRRRRSSDAMSMFFHRNQIYPPIYTYDQLRSSTDGFDPRRKIGDGGFGSVYLAHLDDGRIAAVKRLHRHHPAASTKSFCNEITILSSLRHPSLVRLHGYCFDPRGLLLVYDYVPNGTLADHLHGSRSLYRKGALTWNVRVDVALQIASALEYLHFSLKPPVVHRDITSSNIFVERDMRIKVGDFGLSRLLSLPDPNSDTGDSLDEYVCCTGPQGTPGYLDPEYHKSFRLTEKSDVYSFGVVLLELITGMKAVDMRRDKRDVSLADLVVSRIQVGALHQVVDPVLARQEEEILTIEAVAELAFRCVAGDKDDRPNARELVEELKRIRGQIQDAASK